MTNTSLTSVLSVSVLYNCGPRVEAIMDRVVEFFINAAPTPSYTAESVTQIGGVWEDGLLVVRNALRANKIILYCHGNAEDVGMLLPFAKQISHACMAVVVLIEYPGYGIRHNESFSMQGTNRSLNEAVPIVQKWGMPLYLWGRSMGCAPVLYIARKYQNVIRGCIVISPFKSPIAVRLGFAPPCEVKFNNAENVRHITCPVLVVHGDRDMLIPCSHGKTIAALASSQSIFKAIRGATHNNIYNRLTEIISSVIHFINDTVE